GCGLPVQGQRNVPVFATASEDVQRVRKLVVDLERVPVRIVEIDALLTDVVDRAEDLHVVLPKRGVRVLERRLALHAERNVAETPDARRLPLRGSSILDREQIDRMALPRKGHK